MGTYTITPKKSACSFSPSSRQVSVPPGQPVLTLAAFTTSCAGVPRVVQPSLSTSEVVVAEAVVTDAPYNADPTGVSDATLAFPSALDAVHDKGGGTVYAPAGKYRFNGQLIVHGNVTLRGDWTNPVSTPAAVGTILMSYAQQGNATGQAFITLIGGNNGVRDLAIWYPNQSVSNVSAYPYAIDTFHNAAHVKNVTLYNAYQGISFDNSSASNISRLYATCLKQCVLDDGNAEFAYLDNVLVSNSIWSNAPSAITNRPTTAAARAQLRAYTTANLVGIIVKRADSYSMYDITVKEAAQGISFQQSTQELDNGGGFYGTTAKINALVEQQFLQFGGTQWMHLDLVSEASSLAHSWAPARRAALPANFYNVADFGALPGDTADDTLAIQTALDEARNVGGGTVYLPASTKRLDGYHIGARLAVPAGVELRGSFEFQPLAQGFPGTVLYALRGERHPVTRYERSVHHASGRRSGLRSARRDRRLSGANLRFHGGSRIPVHVPIRRLQQLATRGECDQRLQRRGLRESAFRRLRRHRSPGHGTQERVLRGRRHHDGLVGEGNRQLCVVGHAPSCAA